MHGAVSSRQGELRALGLLLTSTASLLFWLWDISWQATLGQATFWTPPHVALCSAAVLSGMICLRAPKRRRIGQGRSEGATTRARPICDGPGTRIFPVAASFMLLATVIDFRWHDAHPYQEAVLNPPHFMFALSVLMVQLGTVAVAAALQGESGNRLPSWGRYLYIHGAAMVVLWVATMAMEYVARPNLWHGSEFYQVVGALLPVVLVGVSRSSFVKWPATAVAAIYMALTIIVIWILQALPAGPTLEPGLNPLGHFLPPPFPLLLLPPALAVDLLIRHLRAANWKGELIGAGLVGTTFIGIVLVTHWYFADFLLSPAARNYFFAADQWPYHAQLGDWRYSFWTLDPSPRSLLKGVVISVAIASSSAFLGFWLGRGLSRPRRRATGL